MAEIIRNKKALTERPIKTSQATGASLATLGIANSIPLMHGAQGCGAFAKVYLIQHFREPVPIQNTAIDHLTAVMGGDDNIQQALKLLCEKHAPDAISLMTTGLTELQGTDLERNVREFRQAYPMFDHIVIVSVPTPDFVGSLQSGFAAMLDAYVKQVLASDKPSANINSNDKARKNPSSNVNTKQINVLCASLLTTADIEHLKYLFELFGLTGVFVPDISLSLDGHLTTEDYSATSTGGCTISSLKTIPESVATISIGDSVAATGRWLEKEFSIPCHELPHLMGMQANDQLIMWLKHYAECDVPASIERARQRLQDTLIDVHFVASNSTAALALESDLLLGFDALLAEIGCHIPLSVTASTSDKLAACSSEQIIIGDLANLNSVVNNVDFMVGNTHCAEFFEAKVPVFRAGFPCHDRFGNSDRLFIGYSGARACLNEMANLLITHVEESVEPYKSPYRFAAEQVSVNRNYN